MVFVRLLGRPQLVRDGVPSQGPRGHKAWGLLAYLVGSGGPMPRERLAALLFADAADGLAALRWNLAELRRCLGNRDAFVGDPVVPALGADVHIDLQLLGTAPWPDVVDHVELGASLLEGMTFPGCPGFELWLEGERQRVNGLAGGVLREAARAETAAGRPDEAIGYARRLVLLQPWDENAHELLVRALARSGDVAGARAHVDLVTQMFLDELGLPPAQALAAAAEPMLARPAEASRTRTLAQLQAGRSAMSAGAPESGLDSLRKAVASARAVGDPELLVRTLTEWGSAQVHAVRGTDESGAAALREAVAVAERAGRPQLATTACRELAYVEFLRCRFQPAERWLDRAMATVGADESERAWIVLIRGSLRSDQGRYDEGLPLLRDAVRHAEMGGDVSAAAMALTHIGRIHVLRGEHQEAAAALRRAQVLVEQAGWVSFLAYPLAWLGEIALRQGQLDQAAAQFNHAHELALQVADPCWESLACCGLGQLAVANGHSDEAARWLRDAPIACRRFTDTYVWLEAFASAAQAAHALHVGSPAAMDLVDQLDALASMHGMREFQAEAALLRAEAGQVGALAAARVLIDGVDNPVLRRRLAELVAAGGAEAAAIRPAAPARGR